MVGTWELKDITIYQLIWKYFNTLTTERQYQSVSADFRSKVSEVYPPQDVHEASASLEVAIFRFLDERYRQHLNMVPADGALLGDASICRVLR